MKVLLASSSRLLAAAGHAVAQTSYPEQSVRILVGFPAGTAPDVAARIIADKFAPSLGQAGGGRERHRRERQHRGRPRRQGAAATATRC